MIGLEWKLIAKFVVCLSQGSNAEVPTVREGGSGEKRRGTDGEGGVVTTMVKTMTMVTTVTMMTDAFHLRTKMAAVATASVNGSVVTPVTTCGNCSGGGNCDVNCDTSSGGGSRQ